MNLTDEVASVAWYHTIELPGGVVTPGWYDLRSSVSRVALPPSLKGKRCLDVGTCDGFWAFEMERRGADEVVAVDIEPRDWDWAETVDAYSRHASEGRARRAFGIARTVLGSRVDRREISVYELDPEKLGQFDFVFLGALLIHLRDPVRALTAVRNVTRGSFLLCDVFSASLTVLYPKLPASLLSEVDANARWWTPNLAAYRRLLSAAGFQVVQRGRPFFQPFGAGRPPTPLRAGMRLREMSWVLVQRRLGAPACSWLAQPSL